MGRHGTTPTWRLHTPTRAARAAHYRKAHTHGSCAACTTPTQHSKHKAGLACGASQPKKKTKPPRAVTTDNSSIRNDRRRLLSPRCIHGPESRTCTHPSTRTTYNAQRTSDAKGNAFAMVSFFLS